MNEHGHYTLDELAEFDEGLLARRAADRVGTHLRTCEDCQRQLDALTSTRARLAALPPEPLPAEVRERIDRILTEAATSPARTLLAGDGRARNVRTSRWLTWNRPTLAAAAVAIVAVLAVGGTVIGLHHGNHGSTTAGGSGATALAPRSDSSIVSSTGRTYSQRGLAGQVNALLAPTGQSAETFSRAGTTSGGAIPPGTNSAGAGASTGLSHGATTHGSGTKKLGPLAAPHAAAPSLANVPKALDRLRGSPKRLQACIDYIGGAPGTTPLAVDFGRWTGGRFHNAPSIIIVLAQTSTTVGVYVVAPGCRGSTALRQYESIPLRH